MALTFGAYAAPTVARPLAVGAVVALTAVNLLGVDKTALGRPCDRRDRARRRSPWCRAALIGGDRRRRTSGRSPARACAASCRPPGSSSSRSPGTRASRRSARRCIDPGADDPAAIPIALGITLVVYAAVAVTALLAVGPDALAARTAAPLATVVEAGALDWAAPVVRVGAAVASLGVLLSLLAGVGRTTFAMASDGDLPRWLAAVHRDIACPTAPSSRRGRRRRRRPRSPTSAGRSASARSPSSSTTRSPTRRPGPWRVPSGGGRVRSVRSGSWGAPPCRCRFPQRASSSAQESSDWAP